MLPYSMLRSAQADPTRGSVNYIEDGRLAMINSDYNVVLRVDNTKDLGWGEYRDSIRMTSNKPFEKNQLLVLDVVHMRMCLQF